MRIDQLASKAWQRLNPKATDTWLAAVLGIIFRLAGLALLVFGMLIIWRTINSKGYIIKALSMPKRLADSGLNGEITAMHLHDAIQAVKAEAASIKQDDLLLDNSSQEPLNVSVMGLEMSITSIAYQLRQLLGKEQKRITGEFIESENKLYFTLRFSGYPNATFNTSIDSLGSAAAVQHLLRQGSLRILEYTDPYRLAIIHYREKRYDDAIAICRKIISDRPYERTWAYHAWGNTLLSNGELNAALGKFRLAILQDSNFALSHTAMAHVYFKKKEFRKAADCLEKSVTANPDNIDGWSTLGWNYINRGMAAESDSAFKMAIKYSKGTDYYSASWQNWIQAKMRIDSMDAALRVSKLALKEAEEDSDGYILRAFVYYFQKDTLAAFNALETALELDPQNSRAIASGILAAFAVKKYKRVIELQEMQEFNQWNTEQIAVGLNLSSMSHNFLGEHTIALEKIQEAIRIEPNFAMLYTTLGEYYAYKNNPIEFFKNLDIAAQKGYAPQLLNWKDEPYNRFANHPKKVKLIEKYALKD